MIDLWKSIGVTIIYWLAALQTTPQELYEAVRIDGANRRQIFARVTVPLLVPLGMVILLLTFVTSLSAFDIVKVMTDSGPKGATDIVQTYIYRYAFDPGGTPRFGFTSAAGIIFGLAVIVLTIIPVLVRRSRQRQIGPGGGGKPRLLCPLRVNDASTPTGKQTSQVRDGPDGRHKILRQLPAPWC